MRQGTRKTRLFVLGGLALMACAALILGLRSHASGDYPELPELARIDTAWTFEDAAHYFKALAQQKGGAYAYQVLLRAPLPPGIDLHLLGHVIGDVLYKQQGIGGIATCTQDFRNACSHSIVINALLSQGESVLPKLGDVCKKAPGGAGAYTMCFHGLGHGVLAYDSYDLPRAVATCKTLGTPAYHDEEFTQCVGGTIMELIGGVHDPQANAKAQQIYFKPDDPLYPCDAPFMPQEARSMCYTYLTPHLFVAGGGTLAEPQPGFEKAFEFCDKIPASDAADRQACLAGPGKEFVVLAPGRDIRNIGDMQDGDLQKIVSWCALGKAAGGEEYCDGSAVSSLYWGGENDPGAALRYCALLGGVRGSACYTTLFGEASFYARGDARPSFCALVPSSLQEQCRATLKLSA